MAAKMITCKHCGAQIAKSAKTCPNCGGKNKKPIYLRAWFIVLVVLVLLGVIGGAAGSGDKKETSVTQSNETGNTKKDEGNTNEKASEPEKEIVYEEISVGKLMDDLEANALKASETYKGNYYAVTGKLLTIDASGKYISIVDADADFAFTGVQCYIKTDDVKSVVMDLSSDEIITVRGKMKDVGEILGYSLDIDSIERK